MIKLQTQPTPTSCTQACLAMMLGIPVADVLARFPQPMGQWELVKAMVECQLLFNVIALGPVAFEGTYTACVPSLNHAGMNHQIVLDVSFNHPDGQALWVYDPNDGRDGAKTYLRDGSNLNSWTDLIRFQLGGRLPKS